MPKYETRATKGIEIRKAPEDSGFIGVLEGYAAVFESDSVEMAGWEGLFVERIQPGAFKRSLETREDVKALWSHDSSQIIARAPNTLKLHEDKRGLHVEINLVDTTLNRDLMANIKAGNVDSMSFGFEVRGEIWERDKESDEPDVRTLTDVELHEVSVVVWPAYPDTSIAARSHEKFLQTREETEEETEEEPDDGEQLTEHAPHRDLWAAKLGVKTNKVTK